MTQETDLEGFEPIPQDELGLDMISELSARVEKRDNLISQLEQQRNYLRQAIADVTARSEQLLNADLDELTETVGELIGTIGQLDEYMETNAKIRRQLAEEHVQTQRDLEIVLKEVEKSNIQRYLRDCRSLEMEQHPP